MCGIFGAISTGEQFGRAEFDRFRQLTDMVRYRGPDDSGYIALNVRGGSESTNGHFDAFLGNRRLSIIDLSPLGHMPMSDGKGRWITFNGEIFNYVELKEELQRSHGFTFRSGTDTEVILAVYDAYGEDGFDRLNGMWAFAIVDVPGRRLILSRDRFSIKPLYMLHAGNKLFFASEIKQLLPLLTGIELNEEVMMAFLSQGLLDHSDETFFRGITRLPPKTTSVICFDTGKVLNKTYWDFKPLRAAPPDEVIEEFHSILSDSVRIRLRSDVKAGVLLSGGLDSSSIAVLANQFAPLETYSIVAEDPRYDERLFIDKVADCGIRNKKVLFQPDQMRRDIVPALEHSDEPVGGFSVFAQYCLFEAIKKASDATVLLSGQGGDEILLGYLKFFFFHVRELLNNGDYIGALRQLAMGILQRTVARQFTIREARRYSPFLRNRTNHVFRLKRTEVPIWECTNIRARQIADIDRYSVPALTHYEDRNSSAHSLEVRHPFLDHRLVDMAVNLPTETKIHNGWTKYVLRQAVRQLPKDVRWRRDKQGFVVPEEIWLKNEFRPAIETYFQNSKLSQLGILDDSRFLEQYRIFRNGGAVTSSEIARVFIAEVWTRKVVN